ncbi:MAG: ATPase [Burkholderiaceae bacterium]|nr:ATPase [Roseateles sp.]MBV8469000.1 ATPase [Burkholderiaceae bacterium]
MNSLLASHRYIAAPSLLREARYLLGVDGGGTGTRVRLADASGQVLGQAEAGPSALGQGVEQAWIHIEVALSRALEAAGLAPLKRAEVAIGAGLSGGNELALAEKFLARQPGFAAVLLDNDGFTTVLGAHGGRPGAVMAAGTGVVGEALRRDGSRVCVSGWGWITGDEGSGAWLGLRAMRHAQQALDGRVPVTPLARAIWSVAGSKRTDVLAWCSAAGQHGFATLAPLVFEMAAQDATARGFLSDAVAALELLAEVVDPRHELPLALCGSIARRLKSEFSAGVQARCVEPQGDSADGALLMARSELGGLLESR